MGRTTTSSPLNGPGKTCRRAASTPLRYSRKGSEGSKGANGSAGVSRSVVAHEIVCRPTRASNPSPDHARSSRSNRCRHSTSPRRRQRPVEVEPVSRGARRAGRQRRERGARALLVEEQLFVRGFDAEGAQRGSQHEAQVLEVGSAARAEGAGVAHADDVQEIAAERPDLGDARPRSGAGQQGHERQPAGRRRPRAAPRHVTGSRASAGAPPGGRRSRSRRPPGGSGGGRAPSRAGRGWRR